MNVKPLKCELCDYTCWTLEALAYHMEGHYPDATRNERDFQKRQRYIAQTGVQMEGK